LLKDLHNVIVQSGIAHDLPRDDGSGPEHLPQHRVAAGVLKIRIDIGPDEVEEG